jgi:hypothetical protein
MYLPRDRRALVNIPVSIWGEESAPGVKGGAWLHVVNRVVPFMCEGWAVKPAIELDVRKMNVSALFLGMGGLRGTLSNPYQLAAAPHTFLLLSSLSSNTSPLHPLLPPTQIRNAPGVGHHPLLRRPAAPRLLPQGQGPVAARGAVRGQGPGGVARRHRSFHVVRSPVISYIGSYLL